METKQWSSGRYTAKHRRHWYALCLAIVSLKPITVNDALCRMGLSIQGTKDNMESHRGIDISEYKLMQKSRI